MSTPARSGAVAPMGYAELLEQVKVRVRTSRVQAARAVNTELVGLYWQIGRLILDRHVESEGWGSKVIGRLAADLRAEFPGMRGLFQRSLVYMRTFAGAFAAPIAQPAAQLPWGHIMVLLDKVTEPEARQWYAAQTVEHGSGPVRGMQERGTSVSSKAASAQPVRQR